MRQSETVDKLAAALVAAQANMTNPPLDGVNPHFKSKFTTLATMVDHVRNIFAQHGLVVSQHPTGTAGEVGVVTRLMHQSGQWVEEEYSIPLAKNDPQAAGSVITYLRRYALAAIANIQGDEDTDAEAAMDRGAKIASAPAPESVTLAQPADATQVRGFFAKTKELGLDSEYVKDYVKAHNNLDSFTKVTYQQLVEAYKQLNDMKKGAA